MKKQIKKEQVIVDGKRLKNLPLKVITYIGITSGDMNSKHKDDLEYIRKKLNSRDFLSCDYIENETEWEEWMRYVENPSVAKLDHCLENRPDLLQLLNGGGDDPNEKIDEHYDMIVVDDFSQIPTDSKDTASIGNVLNMLDGTVIYDIRTETFITNNLKRFKEFLVDKIVFPNEASSGEVISHE